LGIINHHHPLLKAGSFKGLFPGKKTWDGGGAGHPVDGGDGKPQPG